MADKKSDGVAETENEVETELTARTKKRERQRLSSGGEVYTLECDICGESLKGHAWTFSSLADTWDASLLDQIAYACANCGFAYCKKGHRKELKAKGIGSIRSGPCPECGTMLAGDNLIYITNDPEEFEYRKGLCMTCGSSDPLEKVTIWSGVEIEGDQLSPDITWMGLVVLLPGRKEQKMIKVESKTLEVCGKCMKGIKPENYIIKERVKVELQAYKTQRKPFGETQK